MGKIETVIMKFHFAGVVSKETCKVIREDKTTITLDNDFIFNKKTGTCINDNKTFGAYRTIDIKKLST